MQHSISESIKTNTARGYTSVKIHNSNSTITHTQINKQTISYITDLSQARGDEESLGTWIPLIRRSTSQSILTIKIEESLTD